MLFCRHFSKCLQNNLLLKSYLYLNGFHRVPPPTLFKSKLSPFLVPIAFWKFPNICFYASSSLLQYHKNLDIDKYSFFFYSWKQLAEHLLKGVDEFKSEQLNSEHNIVLLGAYQMPGRCHIDSWDFSIYPSWHSKNPILAEVAGTHPNLSFT